MSDPRTIVLEGDPETLGLTHGRLLGEEIRFLIGQMNSRIFRRVGPLRGIPLRMVSLTYALAMHRHIPNRIEREIRGIARGGGLNYLDLLLLNTLDDILNILRRLAPGPPPLACSSFVLTRSRCRDGGLIHGRNLDYHFRGTPLDDGGAMARLLLQRSLLFVYRPRGYAPFLSVGWPGLVGATTAISRQGLSLGNLTSYLRGTTPRGTPTAILYRQVLEEASSLGEAGQILRRARRTIGNNVMIGSGREDRAALFEFTRDTLLEVPPQDGILISTNHFLSPELARRQRPYLLAHSPPRWQRLQTLCGRPGVGVEDAIGFLADTGCDGVSGGPPSGVANEGTAVSALFRPAEMMMWLGRGKEPPASRGEFVPVDVERMLTHPTGTK